MEVIREFTDYACHIYFDFSVRPDAGVLPDSFDFIKLLACCADAPAKLGSGTSIDV